MNERQAGRHIGWGAEAYGRGWPLRNLHNNQPSLPLRPSEATWKLTISSHELDNCQEQDTDYCCCLHDDLHATCTAYIVTFLLQYARHQFIVPATLWTVWTPN